MSGDGKLYHLLTLLWWDPEAFETELAVVRRWAVWFDSIYRGPVPQRSLNAIRKLMDQQPRRARADTWRASNPYGTELAQLPLKQVLLIDADEASTLTWRSLGTYAMMADMDKGFVLPAARPQGNV